MDDYSILRKVDRLEDKAAGCDAHKIQCDADMEAHGKWLLRTDNAVANLEKDFNRLAAAFDKHVLATDGRQAASTTAIDQLEDFQLKIVTTWKTTVGIVFTGGALIGFIIKLIWDKR